MNTIESSETRKIIYANGKAHPENFGWPQSWDDWEEKLDEVIYMHVFFAPGAITPGAKKFLAMGRRGRSDFEIRRGKVAMGKLPDGSYRKFFECPDDEEGHIVVEATRVHAILFASNVPHPFFDLTRIEVEVRPDSKHPVVAKRERPARKFAERSH